MPEQTRRRLGALIENGGVRFRVWAPKTRRMHVVLEDRNEPVPMESVDDEYHEAFVDGLEAGARYRYRADDTLYPDPASRFQPEGVHGPSMVVDPSRYPWQDAGWNNIPQKDLVFYELHVGTFSPEGSFAGVQERLPYLKDLGITAIEIMPVADFPGRWNWGYDHAALYAPSRAYGTPDEFRALVDAAHQAGLAVFLDVIYNHFGPDGAYAAALAPFFTDKHRTPWGQAINMDDVGNQGVRHFFIDNALHWLREYHLDGFRLDAVHAIKDDSPTHFLEELADAVFALEEAPRRYVVAEDYRNLRTVVLPKAQGGFGLDATWTDDFHHQIRNVTAGDVDGYYRDYTGSTAQHLATTLRQGWYFTGQHSEVLGRARGSDPSGVRLDQCVIHIQNHDQVGNRPYGERLHHDVPLAAYRAASALLLFAPELPLLFMGQEWAASTPFQFFTDHHEELGKLVSEGRREEFKGFTSFKGEVPDPQDEETFRRSRLRWDDLDAPEHASMHRLYRDLLRLRRELPGDPSDFDVEAHGEAGLVLRRGPHVLLAALSGDVTLPLPRGAEPAWHTEQPEYTPDGQAPAVAGGRVHFQTAGALLARVMG